MIEEEVFDGHKVAEVMWAIRNGHITMEDWKMWVAKLCALVSRSSRPRWCLRENFCSRTLLLMLRWLRNSWMFLILSSSSLTH